MRSREEVEAALRIARKKAKEEEGAILDAPMHTYPSYAAHALWCGHIAAYEFVLGLDEDYNDAK